jgi:hypothetical protein
VRAGLPCFSVALIALALAGCGTADDGDAGAGRPFGFDYVLLEDGYYLYERDVGDIDGDGDNDIVGVQEGDTTIEVFRAPDWARSTLITTDGAMRYPRADDFKLADIDGDGDLDVITRLASGPADEGPGIAVWFENLGGGAAF